MKSHCVRVGLVKVPVTDLKRSRRYYRDILRMEEDFVAENFGWVQYNAVAAPFCLYVPGEGGGSVRRKPGGDTGIHLFVNNAAELHAGIRARQGNVSELDVGADGSIFFVVTDPDGNEIRVLEVNM